MIEGGILDFGVGAGDDLGDGWFGLGVVDAVHQQPGRGVGQRLERGQGLADLRQGQVCIEFHLRDVAPVDGVADIGDVVVAIGHPDRGHGRAIGRAPFEFCAQALALGPQPSPEEGIVDAKAAQDLRQLPDMTEAIRHVTDLHHATVVKTHAMPQQQVADERFGADQELVGQHVPRADADPPCFAQGTQLARPLRPHFQIVFQHRHLAVQHVEAVVGPGGQQIEEAVDQAHEPDAVFLKGDVPGAIPMGVADDGGVEGFHACLCGDIVTSI